MVNELNSFFLCDPSTLNFFSLGIESKLHSGALGVGSRLAAMLLRRRFEGAQAADFLENALGIQLVFQPFQCAVDRFTFAHNHFWHQ